jgi:hypothetical protein
MTTTRYGKLGTRKGEGRGNHQLDEDSLVAALEKMAAGPFLWTQQV